MHDSHVPEGWRHDPNDPRLERWWDGLEWTSYTRPARHDSHPLAPSVIQREPVVAAAKAETRFLPWIVWSPTWILMLNLPIVLMSMADATAWLLTPIVAGLGWLLLLWLAARDVSALYRRGFPRRPSIAWMLLTPCRLPHRAVAHPRPGARRRHGLHRAARRRRARVPRLPARHLDLRGGRRDLRDLRGRLARAHHLPRRERADVACRRAAVLRAVRAGTHPRR